MNYKQTLLQSPQIDAVRDKTLSFGCVVKLSKGGVPMLFGSIVSRDDGKHDIHCNSLDDGYPLDLLGAETKHVEEIIIIGHPVTHADLLRALSGKVLDKFLLHGNILDVFDIDDLNHRTLEDIPEDDPCWEQLCKVFNLI